MKKRILKISALVLAVVLIAGVCLFANSLIGNPISKALAKNTAEKYIEENYGDKDLELERVSYSFKDGWYHAYVSSPSSVDTHFILLINGFGKIKDDCYDNSVTNGWNTADRLGTDYRKAVDAIFDSSSFPLRENIGYGELVFVSSEYKDDIETPDYALITNELKLDAFYNVNELGAMSGRLSVYIDDDNVTAERMAEILLEVRECFDNAGVGFYVIDCVLEHSRDENGYFEDGRIEVMDFLHADIYEEGLVERVVEANKAANEYYNVLDGENE